MKAALIQMNIEWNSPDKNLAQAQELASQALAKKADLLIFPEMFTCGFSLPQGEAARRAGQAAFMWLENLARQNNIRACGSAPYAADGDFDRPFNTLRLYGPQGPEGEYHKMHLFSPGGEDKKYRSGDDLFTACIAPWRVSFFICYDLRFPLPFAALADKTDLFIVIANWPKQRRLHWRVLLTARAIENQAYVLGVNRAGRGNNLCYAGDSLAINPAGEILADGGSEKGCAVVELEHGAVAKHRETFPVLRDRRGFTKKCAES